MIKKVIQFFVMTILLVTVVSCSKDNDIIPTTDTNTTNPTTELTEQQQAFQEFWDVYDRHYPLMHRKNIDWQDVYDTYYPQITATTSDAQLFDIFNTIFSSIIKDGHSGLRLNGTQETDFEPDFNADVQAMVENNTASKVNIVASSANNPYLSYGTLVSDENIGYINSKEFEPVNDVDSEFYNFKAIVDEALEALQNKAGIIIDVRTNGGGQGPFAFYLAGRFFSDTTPFDLVRMRYKTATGSSENSLSEWVTESFEGYPDDRAEEGTIGSIYVGDFTVSGSGPFQYTNKVAVLTSRGTASAAEYFAAAMKNQDHVKTIGNTTFGIYAGSEILRLTNGGGKWMTRLSVQDVELLYEGNFESFEGTGIIPDELIIPTTADISGGKDVHIEAALDYLK